MIEYTPYAVQFRYAGTDPVPRSTGSGAGSARPMAGRRFEARPLRLLETDANGNPPLALLNVGLDEARLKDPRNPRWIAKPTVASLWARTVPCKNCGARVPLLKTRCRFLLSLSSLT